MIKLSEVNPAEYNPRTISDKELKKLEVSLEKFGAQRELLINKKTGNLVAVDDFVEDNKYNPELGNRKQRRTERVRLTRLKKKIDKMRATLTKVEKNYYSRLNNIDLKT